MSLDTRTKPTPAWLVREADVPGYHPANHTGTLNRRLIGPDTVGSRHVEVLLGVIEKGQGALPHAHPGIEQVCYLLSGTARAQVADEWAGHGGGRLLLFPAGRAARLHRDQRPARAAAGDLHPAL